MSASCTACSETSFTYIFLTHLLNSCIYFLVYIWRDFYFHYKYQILNLINFQIVLFSGENKIVKKFLNYNFLTFDNTIYKYLKKIKVMTTLVTSAIIMESSRNPKRNKLQYRLHFIDIFTFTSVHHFFITFKNFIW